jgi:hypothetical protein
VERFAVFAEGFRAKPLPTPVLHHAKPAVIDWYAARLAGAAVPPAALNLASSDKRTSATANRLRLRRRS